MAKVSIPTVTLNNGGKLPVLGYGTWLGFDEKLDPRIFDVPKLIETLSYAIDIGYRHIDTAHFYRVEPEVGQVVNEKIKLGIVKRDELFITTKVWQNYHREADVEVSVRASLKRLNLDYLDQVLIHWPVSVSENGVDEKIDYLETWRGFESVLAKGLTKSIGVSNFNVDQLRRLLANCKVIPATNQIEVNLNLGQNELVEYCQSHNIVVVAYSPFGTMVPGQGPPDSPEPKLNNPTLVAIAKKYGKTVTQITLRYLRGLVSIPKTVTKARVLENATIFDFIIDDDDVKTLAQFNNGYRTVTSNFYQDYENYPFEKPSGEKQQLPSSFLKWKNGVNGDIE
ncbi:unnamed protein product [Diatraea saccharalis]|uniref:NADP-dependent oxidoreductase domain-containing protein n=1 Tax=Diatraea saccharalis TaxID=40085 RepID=A0A9N9REC6_9NEOP|nr:unnamed protein product [Diatraea saccharalis]